MLLYLIVGCALIAVIALLLKRLSQANEKTYHRIVKWGGIVFLLLVAIIFLRAGWPIIAAVVGGAGVLLPQIVRFLRIVGMLRFVHSFFRGAKQNAKQQKQSPASANMTRKQAAEILGIKEDATPKEIKARYQQLMKQVHPDKGGSAHFAQQLNDAKSVLLKK